MHDVTTPVTTTAARLRFTPGPMFPGMRPVGRLLHGGDRPHHVVVDAENLHALRALLHTHARRVDLICIDPPYSSGAPEPAHDGRCAGDSGTSPVATWVAFMERRIVLARGLLKDDGVLVVTIGQDEVAALAVLLGRALPDAEIARVTLAIDPGGADRAPLARVDQYAFFCFLGGANRVDGGGRRVTPGTVWLRREHTGGRLLHALLGADPRFPHAKSLYVTRDAIRAAVGDRPDAVVLDFFAGSGTTMHAVALLNAEDGGSRQSISVTNNELTEQDAAALRRRGLGPGDAEWDALGVFHRVTRPRIEAAITGRTPAGDRVIGEYAGTGRPIADGLAESADFFELTYQR